MLIGVREKLVIDVGYFLSILLKYENLKILKICCLWLLPNRYLYEINHALTTNGMLVLTNLIGTA